MDSEEVVIEGAPLSDGIAIGSTHFLKKTNTEKIPDYAIHQLQAEREVKRYRKALSLSREELQDQQTYLAKEGLDDAANILDAHIQMLEDPLITDVETQIRSRLRNTEAVFRSVISEYETQFTKVADDFFKQRLIDVKDLSERIMWHLRPKHRKQLAALPKDSVLVAEEIVPSDAAEALRVGALAFITNIGGETSHTALIAKARGIPYVADVDLKPHEDKKIDAVIVDGITGRVILNPTEETLARYQNLKQELLAISEKFLADTKLPSETSDGVAIDVMANIDSVDDMKKMEESGAAGVGLFRSEYLFLEEEVSTSEDRQEVIYRKILEEANGLPVTFRLFDVGGDKDFCPTFNSTVNPALGCRAIRFLISRPEIFRTQVRSLLKAGKGKELRILLPLISDVDELRFSRYLIYDERDKIPLEDRPKSLQIGVMIEVPSAVMIVEKLAQECDFFSIGTNDLTQYSLAVDRADPKLRKAFQPAHPSILQMIGKAANAHPVPVSLCGDLAADSLFTPLLIGLGVRQLSCPSRYIPEIKAAVRATCLNEAQELAAKAQTLSTQDEVIALLKGEPAA